MEVGRFSSTYMGISYLSIFPWSGILRSLITLMTRNPCNKYPWRLIKESYWFKKIKSSITSQTNFMYLQLTDSKCSGSINVINTWHPGNQCDTLFQILKLKIRMKHSTAAYTWYIKNLYTRAMTQWYKNEYSQKWCPPLLKGIWSNTVRAT